MIRLPNLDDQRYSDIVETAKRRIPVIFPEWTDMNEHDPGITMIELFAWLKEMQQYYLNRLSDSSYENMLRMLGIEVQSPVPATAEVRFRSAPEYVMKGAEALGSDGLVYVNETPFERQPFALGRIYLEAGGSVHDVTELMRDRDADVYPFGSTRNDGQRRLYIGLEILHEDFFSKGATLVFDIADKCPIPRNPAREGCRIPRELVWEYSTAEGFKPCIEVRDETLALSYSGEVRLSADLDIEETTAGGKLPAGKYFRVSLVEGGCEEMPAISTIYTNHLFLTQKTRGSSFVDLVSDGSPAVIRDKLLSDGLSYVLVRDTAGWRYADHATIINNRSEVTIDLEHCDLVPVQDGQPNLRVIFAGEHFGRTRMFFSSSGLPDQSFSIETDDDVLTDTLRIMVSQQDEHGDPLWVDYTYTDSLALAGPYDRVFTYDRDNRVILFGDNENGEVPERGEDAIMVISCEYTGGSRGNLRRGNLKLLDSGLGEYEIEQPRDASGGCDKETLKQALDRLKLHLNDCTKAVSAEDYHTLALRTPGVRIADAKAIPCFDPDQPNAGMDKLAGTVTLAVLPYSNDEFPLPDESFLAAVREHMEDYRMITTCLKVIAPIYVKVDITAEVRCSVSERAQISQCVEDAVRRLYSVYVSGGAKFGEPVSENSVIAEINSVEGVLAVSRLQIHIEDSRCYRDKYGRIVIPPHAIACPGNIHIFVEEP